MQTSKDYRPTEGSHLTEEQAKRYGKCLDGLAQETGILTAGIVVAEAEKRTSPLHDYFLWDNNEAAKEFRLEQARRLIRSISVTIINNGEKTPIRRFFNIPATPSMNTENSKVYVSLDTIKSDKEMRDEVIGYALRELRGWRERYALYQELEPMTSAIEKFLVGKQ